MTEIERMQAFSYLDGAADGLKEARNDVIEELENIWEKIRALPDINPDYPMDRQIHISRYEVQNIIYERLSELKGEAADDK